MNLKFKNGKRSLPQLSNHIGFIFQQNMILHGGMNENNDVESKWFLINMLTETCEEIYVESEMKDLCYHRCVAIGNQNNQKIFQDKFSGNGVNQKSDQQRDISDMRTDLFMMGNASPLSFNQDKDNTSDYVVYIFGGVNQNLESKNDLFRADFVNGCMKVTKVPCLGRLPGPRYAHAMTFLTNLKAIAIFGGIGTLNNEEVFYNDLHLFFPYNVTWVRVRTSRKIEPRAFTNICEYQNSGIIVFGGTGPKNFIDANFQIFKLTADVEKYLSTSPIEQTSVDYFLKLFGHSIDFEE